MSKHIGLAVLAATTMSLIVNPSYGIGTAFTYQGRITEGDSAVEGNCDFEFSLHNTATDGAQIGATVDRDGVAVSAGVFTVSLDFGAGLFIGEKLWLEVAVRCPAGSGDFAAFDARQELTPNPNSLYASRAGSASWNDLTDVPPDFADGTDDTAESLGAGLTRVDGQLGILFSGPGSFNTAARSDHDHLGQTWNRINEPLRIEGSFSQSSPLALVSVQGDGLRVAAGDDGIEVSQSGDDGVHVVDAGDDGVAVDNANDDGIRVNNSGDDGFDVNNAGGDGLRVGSADDIGVRVESAPIGASFTADDIGIVAEAIRPLNGTVPEPATGVRVESTDVGMRVARAGRVGLAIEQVGEEQELAQLSGLCTIDAVPNTGIMVAGVAGYGIMIEGATNTALRISPAGFNGNGFSSGLSAPESAQGNGQVGFDGASGITVQTINHGVGIHVGSQDGGIAYSGVNESNETATAAFFNHGSETGSGPAAALHVTGGPGLSADIVLGATDDSEFGDNGTIISDPDHDGSDIVLIASDDVGIFLESASQQDGEFTIVKSPLNTLFRVDSNGNVSADGTFSPGGADFAEMLPAGEELEAGDVLAVDDHGKMVRSDSAFQQSVVGVYSTQPGFVGGASEEDDGSRIPVAVVGVVPVKASDEGGEIRPGDLLAASSLPGRAMRAGSDPPVGTVIGKALQSLDAPTGTITMLVTLQ